MAAVAIQRAFAAEDWPTPRPIKVRIGLYTGDAELRGGDYYGSVVNRCARLRNIGHGGQTLLAFSTYDLLHGALPPDVDLIDLGEQHLRDLNQPERVFQIVVVGLPGVPALRRVRMPGPACPASLRPCRASRRC